MKWIAAVCLALSLLCAAQAQEEPAADSPEYFTANYYKLIDTDKDDLVTLNELHAYMKKEAGQDKVKDTKNDKYVEQMVLMLPDYLAADSSDDCSLTRAELIEFYRQRAAGKSYTPKLSVPDVNIIRAELIEPMALLSIKDADKNEDGEVSKQEAKDANPEEDSDDMFKLTDTDGDGKLSFTEVVELFMQFVLSGYDLPEDEYDYSMCYRTKSNSWIVHFEDKLGEGMSFSQKVEVLEVLEDHAKVRITALDKELKPAEGAKPNESIVKFTSLAGPKAKGKFEPVIDEETITVKAGKFECRRIVIDEVLEKTTAWYSIKHPGLLVKSEKIAEGKVAYTFELYEFTPASDD